MIFGINTTSDITIFKYHKWYLCQKSRANHAIICLYYYPQRFCNFHMWVFEINLKYHCCSSIREEINNTANTEQRQGWTNLKKIKKQIAIVVFENLVF